MTWIAVIVASISVWIGAEIGSIIAMLLGRYIVRTPIQKKIENYKIFNAIDQAIAEKGLLLIILLRLSPLIPFNIFNYGMGVTGIKLTHYAIGGVGMIPGVVVYVYFGSALSSVSDAIAGDFDGGWLNLVLIIGGSILALIAVIVVSCFIKKAIQKILKEEREKKKAMQSSVDDKAVDEENIQIPESNVNQAKST